MSRNQHGTLSLTVVGIDVGGEWKGFHAVALEDGTFVRKTTATDRAAIVSGCLDQKTTVVAVDAPCGWSQAGSSRLAERELKVLGEKMYRSRRLCENKLWPSIFTNGYSMEKNFTTA